MKLQLTELFLLPPPKKKPQPFLEKKELCYEDTIYGRNKGGMQSALADCRNLKEDYPQLR